MTTLNQVCFRTLQFDQPWTYENYLKVDGYKAWRKILKEKITPEQIVDEMVRGHMLADLVAIIGTQDIVFGEVDR